MTPTDLAIIPLAVVAGGLILVVAGFLLAAVAAARTGTASVIGVRLVFGGLGTFLAGLAVLILLVPASRLPAPVGLVIGGLLGIVAIVVLFVATRVRQGT